ncbi:MAG: hypothetical protein ACTSWP_06120 [Candidatus Freyarchaeota archaeon]|nr:hypothetical protein [Candidatus Freyrarchaeum guaymaensis]
MFSLRDIPLFSGLNLILVLMYASLAADAWARRLAGRVTVGVCYC